jgi:hypothetical protein
VPPASASTRRPAQQFVALLQGDACGAEAANNRVLRKLKSKIAKLSKRAGKLDDATRAALITRLLRQSDTLLDRATGILAKAVADGKLSATCAAALQAFVDELRLCLGA